MQLLPHRVKLPAAVVFYLSLTAGAILYFSNEGELSNWLELEIWVPALINDDFMNESSGLWIKNNIVDELLSLLILCAGTTLVFAKEKIEDEYTTLLRSSALQWAMIVNTLIVLLATFTVYGLAYFNFMVIQLFSLLLLFNLRFQYTLFRHYSSLSHDE
jgi:hypothetical protein